MTQPKSEPSERALKLVECVPHHWRCDPSGGLKEVEPCGPRCDRYTTAQDIDTAIAEARRDERERAACECERIWKESPNERPHYRQNAIADGCIESAAAIRALIAEKP